MPPIRTGYSVGERLREKLLKPLSRRVAHRGRVSSTLGAKSLASYWQTNYNHRQPHRSLAHLPPVEFAASPNSFPRAVSPDPQFPSLCRWASRGFKKDRESDYPWYVISGPVMTQGGLTKLKLARIRVRSSPRFGRRTRRDAPRPGGM